VNAVMADTCLDNILMNLVFKKSWHASNKLVRCKSFAPALPITNISNLFWHGNHHTTL